MESTYRPSKGSSYTPNDDALDPSTGNGSTQCARSRTNTRAPVAYTATYCPPNGSDGTSGKGLSHRHAWVERRSAKGHGPSDDSTDNSAPNSVAPFRINEFDRVVVDVDVKVGLLPTEQDRIKRDPPPRNRIVVPCAKPNEVMISI